MKFLSRKQVTWTTEDEWTGVVTTHTAPAPTRAQRRVIEALRNPAPVVEEW